MTRFPWLLPVLLLASPLAAQSPEGVTLAEAIGRAARYDPQVIAARGGVRSSGMGVLAARGAFLPSLNANASRGSSFSEGPERIDPATGQIISGDIRSGSLNMGLSSDLELFAGFSRTGNLRAARGREDAADASLEEALATSTLQTSNAFFDALASRELLRVRQEGVARAEQQLAIAVARLRTRAASVGDSLRAEVQLVDAQLALVDQEARLAATEAALARRLGLPGRVAAVDDPALVPSDQPVDLDALLSEATARAPAVRRTEASVRAAEGSLTAARAAWWPRLNLSGNYSFSGSNRTDYTLYNSRSITLALNFPIFNRFQREQGIAGRQVELDTERARAEDARREVAERLTAQTANLEAARQRIALTRRAVEAARADVAVALERYQLGTITIVELTSSQDGLTRAEQNAVQARFDYLRARAAIEATLGRAL